MNLQLKERLLKAASLVGIDSFENTATGVSPVRCGGRVYVSDVGCDHAYLSLHLVLSGVADGAIASDLRKGPLAYAQANIESFSCQDKITALQTDGLTGIEPYDPTDIVICGMGGETILNILNENPFVREKGRRLILQPMTGISEVALCLSLNGYRIYAERYALDGNKPYRIIGAVYDGRIREYPLAESLVGSLFFPEDREAFLAFCQKTVSAVQKKINGLKAGGYDAVYLETLRNDLLVKVNTVIRSPH